MFTLTITKRVKQQSQDAAETIEVATFHSHEESINLGKIADAFHPKKRKTRSDKGKTRQPELIQ